MKTFAPFSAVPLRPATRILITAVLCSGGLMATESQALPAGSWQYQWGDEFNGNSLDLRKWSYNYPWGSTHNHDAYMDPNNVILGDGTLTLRAERQASGGMPFTSGAISSGYNTFTVSHGYIEANIKLPSTPGSWPAFWGLYNGWPPEADIMEYPIDTAAGSGYSVDQYHTAFHYSNSSGGNSAGAGQVNPGSAGSLNTDYHTFGMEWREDDWVGFYFDGNLVSSFGDDTAIAQMQHMYLILNYAVGGWPGMPNLTEWPEGHYDDMKVDWVRVWQLGDAKDTSWSYSGTNQNVNWDSSSNWTNGVPNLGGIDASFDTVNASNQNIDWSGFRAASSLSFDGSTAYRLGSGTDRLILVGNQSASGTSTITMAPSTSSPQQVLTGLELHADLTVTNASAQPLSLSGPISGDGDVVVKGGGRVNLGSVSTYRGNTVVEDGTLALTGGAGLAGTPRIEIRQGTTLDVTGLVRTEFRVYEDQVLDTAAQSTVVGDVIVESGGAVEGQGLFQGSIFAYSGSTIRVGQAGLPVSISEVMVDDFSSGDLAPYTETRILDLGSSDNVSFSSSGGLLTVNSDRTDGAEQTVLLRSDIGLDIGQELRVDAKITSTNDRDLGIVVAATDMPTELTRSDYAMVFLRSSSTQVGSSGFDGTTELRLAQYFSDVDVDTLFIKRLDESTFELGYYIENDRTVMTTRTMSNTATGSAIGFYSDLRSDGTISGLDNLRIYDTLNPVLAGEQMTIDGSLTLHPDATLEIGIASVDAHDTLLVHGQATLNGTLDLVMADSMDLSIGDQMTLLDSEGGISGWFSEIRDIDLAPMDGLDVSLAILLSDDDVIARVTIDGDANLDNSVDLLDLSALASSFGSEGGWKNGDFNDDGNVDLLDLSILARQFGDSYQSAVPAPATATSLVLLGLLHHRRR